MRKQLVEEQRALAKESADLDAERKGMGGGTAATATQANARSEALNARITSWNQRNAALVKEGEDLTQERDLWASECGNRRYREDDEIAIKQGK
jgi:cell division protein FtsB